MIDSLVERVRPLVQRLAPVGICGGCIAERLDLSAPADVESATRLLAGQDGFERSIDACGICGEKRPIIRHRS